MQDKMGGERKIFMQNVTIKVLQSVLYKFRMVLASVVLLLLSGEASSKQKINFLVIDTPFSLI